jgi:hypothetical protein
VTVGAGGSILITVDWTAGINSLLSGIFLGGAGAPPPAPPQATLEQPGVQGDWVGTYGADGYILAGWNATSDLAVLPPGVSYTLLEGVLHSWEASTNEVRAVESPEQTYRRATAWYGPGSAYTFNRIRVRLDFATAYSNTLHLYALDWSTTDRRESITVDDGHGPRVIQLTNSFDSGAWLHFPVTVGAGGSILITVDWTAGINSLLSGIFLGGAGGSGPTVPAAPGTPTATPGSESVTLSWSPPASDGGSAILSYTATASPGGASCSTAATSCTVTGLTNGTTYSFTVTATNAVGTGPASGPAIATPQAAATAPGAPQGLSATPGNAQATLSWAAPASDGGSAILSYTATASPSGATCTTAGTSCTITGLANGTSYSFTVTATNAVGTGPASTPATATPATVPGAPQGVGATPGNSQVTVSWAAPASDGGSAILSYTATASPGGASCTTAATGCTIAGLTNGTTYSITVTATNAVGTGPASTPATATPATVPGAPQSLNATPSSGQVALSWAAPASDGGSAILSYTVTANPGGATCTTAGTSCTIAGLTNGTSYSFTVRATNALGTGPASSPVTATPATVPSAPQNLLASPHRSKGINLSWTAPASNGGSAITGYQIYRRTATGTWVRIATISPLTTYRDAGTQKNTLYYYYVVAVNAVGVSLASNEASATAK